LLLIVPLLIVVVAIGVLNAPESVENRVAPPATVASAIDSGHLSADEQAYMEGLRPYLDVLVGEGRALEQLGQSRSRNIVELTVRMDRYRGAAKDIDQYIQHHQAPTGLADFVGQLQQQIADSLQAIDASVDAIRHFDWEALGGTVDAFSAAVDSIATLAGTPLAASG
jgi:hypothetical protein